MNAPAMNHDIEVFPGAAALAAQPLNASPAGPCRDPLIERLVRALLPDDAAKEVLRGFYTDALHATLLKRLAELRGGAGRGSAQIKLAPLPTWRLKRVYEYVEDNLEERITLAGLAKAAGLTRMHFAAQFRVATGLRPHDYVVHRRMQHAKALLSGSNAPIVDVALSAGFQTQAHFTTVFKRFAGITPKQWRVMQCHPAKCFHRAAGKG